MFFTERGLEQATRPVVAARRAAHLRAAGVRAIADLGCGIGGDALSFARTGMKVYAYEADRSTWAIASANVAALGLADLIEVHCSDATTMDLAGVDAVFCDPSRRSPGGRRVFDPTWFSPPWEFAARLPRRIPRTVLKVAPEIDHALVPPGAEAEWVSVDGTVVEAAFWCGPLASVPRRATVIRGSAHATLTGTGTHLVAEFASTVDGVLADVLRFSLKRLPAARRERPDRECSRAPLGNRSPSCAVRCSHRPR